MTHASSPRFAHASIASGTRLHYAEYGDPGGEPVVFVHGWPDSWFSFSRVLPLLADGFRCIAIDQRGFGESERPGSSYTIPEMGADLIALLDDLGIERAALVGHSFGSFVSRQATLAQPRRVAALVLIGTGFTSSNPVTREVQSSMRDLPDPIPVSFARDFQSSTVHHPVPSEFFDRIVAESLKLPPRLWRLTFDRLLEYDDTRQIERIEVPTLLLWGDRDALFPRTDQDRFVAALPSARLAVYEDTGHCPNWERPDRVAADIAAFVRRR
jgi:pimeloyl-ACP methyl ester carboxylesterase